MNKKIFVLLCSTIVVGSLVWLCPQVSASGWSSATVTTDKNIYYQGEIVRITVTGTDSDSNKNDNNIDVRIYYGIVREVESWTDVNPGGPTGEGPKNFNWYIGSSEPGTYTIYVYRTGEFFSIGSKSITVYTQPIRDYIELKRGQYTNDYKYVPGEILYVTIHGTASTNYKFRIVHGDSEPLSNVSLTTDSNGIVKYEWAIPTVSADGEYAAELYIAASGLRIDREIFEIKLYEFRLLETDRDGYILGEKVRITYSVNNIKDGTLVPDGYYGKLVVYDAQNSVLDTRSFSVSFGAIEFPLSTAITRLGTFKVLAWYNQTADTKPAHWAYGYESFEAGNLRALVSTKASYAPGELVTLNVRSYVNKYGYSYYQVCGSPTCEARIEVAWKKKTETSYTKAEEYSATLMTDFHGNGYHNFVLSPATEDETMFKVNVTVTKIFDGNTLATTYTECTFTVLKSVSRISVSLEPDKNSYLAGDTAVLTVHASLPGSTGQSFTYLYEIRDGSAAGNILAVNTSSSNVLKYAIPSNFQGMLYFGVQVFDGVGHQGSDAEIRRVVYGEFVVNTDLTEYSGGETVSITYFLVSTTISSPRFYYTITDSNGISVATAETSGGKFTFVIPAVPDDFYSIIVQAVKDGKTITSNTVRLTRISGYILIFSIVSESAYTTNTFAPGNTIILHYKLIARGSAKLPANIELVYGLSGFPMQRYATSNLEGDITYTIPGNAPNGNLIFSMTAIGFAASTGTISIDSSPSVANYRVAGVSLLDFTLSILLLIIIIAIVIRLVLSQRARFRFPRRGKKQAEMQMPPPSPPPPSPPQQPPVQPQTPIYSPYYYTPPMSQPKAKKKRAW